jgi:hypothetical protein
MVATWASRSNMSIHLEVSIWPMVEGLQGGGLLHEVVLGQNVLLGADPADAVAGGQDLGEGAQIDHQALGIQALQGGQILALEPQLAVGVILDDGDLVRLTISMNWWRRSRSQVRPVGFWKSGMT